MPAGSVSAAQVELRLAGTFRVIRDGTELTEGEIGSRKSRTLLKLLAVERPALSPRTASSTSCGPQPAGGARAERRDPGQQAPRSPRDGPYSGRPIGYRLADGPGIMIDLDAAARFCDQAEGKVATAAAVALAAAERGHALLASGTAISDEPYASWADPAREQVRELLRRLRLIAAEAAMATGDPGWRPATRPRLWPRTHSTKRPTAGTCRPRPPPASRRKPSPLMRCCSGG